MDTSVIFILEIIGTVAFAVSGAMVAMKKGMDVFGVAMLGLCTAVGGGVLRDVLLGLTPPATFQNPVYALTAIAVSVFAFIPAVRRFLDRHAHQYGCILTVMDALGLEIFTVIGVQCAFDRSNDYSLFLLVFVGVITGVGGGVLRDMLAGNTPYIFVKHFYACTSLAGALLCALLWRVLGSGAAMPLGAAAVVALRLCAARFRWSLPKAAMK